MVRYIFIFLLMLACGLQILPAQTHIPATDRIEALAKELYRKDLSDSAKYGINKEIEDLLKPLIAADSAPELFDSLTFLKYLSPADNKFELLTWAFPVSDSRFYYSGIIHLSGGDTRGDTTITMHASDKIPEVNKPYPLSQWPGAVYYKLSENTWKKEHHYTLLGWMGSKTGEDQRVIEILKFHDDSLPEFGAPVIVTGNGTKQCRMLFRFTDAVPFHLQFEQHPLPGKTKKKMEMIVFNELTGNNPKMGRMFRAPVPDYSAFDALVFQKGIWHLYKNVDLRVDTRHLNSKPPKELELGTPKLKNKQD